MEINKTNKKVFIRDSGNTFFRSYRKVFYSTVFFLLFPRSQLKDVVNSPHLHTRRPSKIVWTYMNELYKVYFGRVGW